MKLRNLLNQILLSSNKFISLTWKEGKKGETEGGREEGKKGERKEGRERKRKRKKKKKKKSHLISNLVLFTRSQIILQMNRSWRATRQSGVLFGLCQFVSSLKCLPFVRHLFPL